MPAVNTGPYRTLTEVGWGGANLGVLKVDLGPSFQMNIPGSSEFYNVPFMRLYVDGAEIAKVGSWLMWTRPFSDSAPPSGFPSIYDVDPDYYGPDIPGWGPGLSIPNEVKEDGTYDGDPDHEDANNAKCAPKIPTQANFDGHLVMATNYPNRLEVTPNKAYARGTVNFFLNLKKIKTDYPDWTEIKATVVIITDNQPNDASTTPGTGIDYDVYSGFKETDLSITTGGTQPGTVSGLPTSKFNASVAMTNPINRATVVDVAELVITKTGGDPTLTLL